MKRLFGGVVVDGAGSGGEGGDGGSERKDRRSESVFACYRASRNVARGVEDIFEEIEKLGADRGGTLNRAGGGGGDGGGTRVKGEVVEGEKEESEEEVGEESSNR